MSSTTTGVAYTSPAVGYTHFCCSFETDARESFRSPALKRVPCTSWLYIGQSLGSCDTLSRPSHSSLSEFWNCAKLKVPTRQKPIRTGIFLNMNHLRSASVLLI